MSSRSPEPAARAATRAHAAPDALDRSQLRTAVLCGIAALTVLLAWRTESSRDFGYHLATGRWILEHRAWPRVDSFTWTLAGRPYVDMHGLFQIALALAYGAGGMIGIGVLRVLLAVTTFALLWASARQRKVESPALLGLGFALALLAWEGRLTMRPELATGVCLALQLLLLRRYADTSQRRYLVATVPLQLVWVYAHALSLLGIAVLGLHAAATSVSGLRRRAVDPAPWLALLANTAVMFLNPYGAEGVWFLWNLHTRIQPGNPFADSILELRSPFSSAAAGMPSLWFFKALLVASALAVIAAARRLSLFDLAVVALFGVLSAMRMRVVGLFAVAALPVALEAASRWDRALDLKIPRAAAALALSLLGLLCFATVSGTLYSFDRYPIRFGHAESPGVFPIGNVETLRESGLHGRIFNAIEAGGYLAMHRPEDKTFVDGRLEVIDDDFYRDYLRAICAVAWDQLEQRYHPTLALVPANQRDLVKRLHEDPGWHLIGVDAVSFLFARDTPDQHAAIAASLERLRRLDRPAAEDEGRIEPGTGPSPLATLLGPRRFPFEAFGRGSNDLQVGLFEAARRELRLALLTANVQDAAIVKAYVIATAQLGRIDEARAWCRKLVELAPNDEDARVMLDRLFG